MARDISEGLRHELEQPETDEAILVFLELSHKDLEAPLRVVADAVDYIWNGETYQGFQFDLQLVSDKESPPRGKLTLQNVDERIGHTVLALNGPMRVRVDLIAASAFDQTTDPRVPLESGDPAPDYTADKLFLTDVTGDVFELSGTLKGWDYIQEIWPGTRATQNRLPGLFR